MLTFLTIITCPPLLKLISNFASEILSSYLSDQHYRLSFIFGWQTKKQSYHSYISYHHYLPSLMKAHQQFWPFHTLPFLPFLHILPALLIFQRKEMRVFIQKLSKLRKTSNLTLLLFLPTITKLPSPFPTPFRASTRG